MKKYDFSYLIEKINNKNFSKTPFTHIYIEDFLSDEHFSEIVNSKEINTCKTASDEELFKTLTRNGYEIISFPGCITNKREYISWHKNKSKSNKYFETNEGFGMVLRLTNPKSDILMALKDFITGKKFNICIANKFSIDLENSSIDGGIQKYLDGYEISPHPDLKAKAATFMVNINPNKISEKLDHHTHYLKLVPERSYIERLWEKNETIDRCWLPWDWAQTIFQQTKNNSIVLFSPSHKTLHAVKANYDHLKTQRTQLYGNLWYKSQNVHKDIDWKGLDILSNTKNRPKTIRQKFTSLIPDNLKNSLKKFI